eukprot:GHVR01069043.1.p1 GENE.GHVR01069043.1~~GHVR01069043.1.p1  ORF type:complete len:137 (-),score=15.39 GHVR01069043.1:187-597(-)
MCAFHGDQQPQLIQPVHAITRGWEKAVRKTKLCPKHQIGTCTQGARCKFAHSNDKLRPRPDVFKTAMCYVVEAGHPCSRGNTCPFAHSKREQYFMRTRIGAEWVAWKSSASVCVFICVYFLCLFLLIFIRNKNLWK